MTRAPGLHLPTVVGRLRADRGLLLLVGAVVAVATALMAAVAPVTEHAADRAMAAAVRDAGPRGTLQATLPEWYDDPSGKARDPGTATQVRQDADFVRSAMPRELTDVLQPGVTTVTTLPLHLLDAGPGRYLQIAFVDTADGLPAVTYDEGGAPGLARGEDKGGTVQVAVSVAVARALDLQVGDRVPARDEFGRAVVVVVSGTFEPDDRTDEAWQVAPQLLEPTTSTSADEPRTAGTALVTDESLADLRLALPGDALRRRVVFAPDAAAVTWHGAALLERTVAALQSGAGAGLGETSWDSLLGTVLHDGRAQVAAARGQAQVLLVGLLASALLVLVLAGQLLVRRRRGSLVVSRERGAGLPGIAGELLVESLVITAAGAAVGVSVALLTTGSVGWAWVLPVLAVSAVAAPVLAVGLVRRLASRAPANRSVRRARARAADLRRVVVELAVVAAAGLSWVALAQRGVVGEDLAGGDLTAASAVTWVAVAGALVLLRLAPPVLQWALRRTRRSVTGVPLFVTARLVGTATRALPLVVVLVAVSGTTFAAALAATLHDDQAAGALSVVGGDARLDARVGALTDAVDQVAAAPGVRAAAAGRVEDGVRVSAHGGAASVRLVVVDATAYADLLDVSDLPDAPQLGRLRSGTEDRVPALFLGGAPGLRDDPSMRWEDASVPLDVVGTAPDVEASLDPVVVVDAQALADAGVDAPPDTVWAVGPGAERALATVAEETPGSTVVSYADELGRRRDAALPSAMAGLAAASCVLLPALALLGVALAAAAGSPGRRTALGRLRALGSSGSDLRRVLLGELVVPVAVAALAGLGLGAACAHLALGSLSLQRLTLAPGSPDPVVPWWTVLPVLLLLAWAAGLALLEWRRVRRTPLAQLLRT